MHVHFDSVFLKEDEERQALRLKRKEEEKMERLKLAQANKNSGRRKAVRRTLTNPAGYLDVANQWFQQRGQNGRPTPFTVFSNEALAALGIPIATDEQTLNDRLLLNYLAGGIGFHDEACNS